MTRTVNTTHFCNRCKVNIKKFINTEFGDIQGKYLCLCEEFNVNYMIKQEPLVSA